MELLTVKRDQGVSTPNTILGQDQHRNICNRSQTKLFIEKENIAFKYKIVKEEDLSLTTMKM